MFPRLSKPVTRTKEHFLGIAIAILGCVAGLIQGIVAAAEVIAEAGCSAAATADVTAAVAGVEAAIAIVSAERDGRSVLFALDAALVAL